MLLVATRTINYLIDTDALKNDKIAHACDELSYNSKALQSFYDIEDYLLSTESDGQKETDYIDNIKIYSTAFGLIDKLEYEYINDDNDVYEDTIY